MEWYWWALIAAGIVLIGILKIKVWNVVKKHKQSKRDIEDTEE